MRIHAAREQTRGGSDLGWRLLRPSVRPSVRPHSFKPRTSALLRKEIMFVRVKEREGEMEMEVSWSNIDKKSRHKISDSSVVRRTLKNEWPGREFERPKDRDGGLIGAVFVFVVDSV